MPAPSLIIFGASGRTGSRLASYMAAAGYHLLCPSHAELALEDAQALSDYICAHPEVSGLINCAAISSLEACLDDPVLAHRVNAMAPATMAIASRHTGAKLIHLSTDYALDGRKKGLKTEKHPRRPINVYGASKEEAEWQIAEENPEALIMRVSWVCGNPDQASFIESTCSKALQGAPLAAIDDKWSLPTHVDDIARACHICLTRPECRGLIHLCSYGAQPLSWFDCAQMVLAELHEQGALTSIPEVQRQKLDRVPFFRDPRPRHTAMDATRLVGEWGIPMLTPQQSIRAAVRAFLVRQSS